MVQGSVCGLSRAGVTQGRLNGWASSERSRILSRGTEGGAGGSQKWIPLGELWGNLARIMTPAVDWSSRHICASAPYTSMGRWQMAQGLEPRIDHGTLLITELI